MIVFIVCDSFKDCLWCIKSILDKKFDQAKKEWKPVFDDDKPILEKRLYNEYIELSNKIEEIKKNWKENKVKQLIEVLDKVEYKEIIDELNNYLKEKRKIDNKKAPKK